VLTDIAARRMGLDPVELRRRNLLRADELPCLNPVGIPYTAITPSETFEQALAMLDYGAFRREQEQARAEDRYLGVGMCTYVEPTAGITPMYATEGATIRIEPTGKVNVYVAGGSTGNSLETTVVQLTADALGVDIADVNTIQGDTAIAPFGGGTGGSRSGSVTTGAVAETAAGLRTRIIAIAAHHLGVTAEKIGLGGSRARVRGTPSSTASLAEIAGIAYFRPDDLPPRGPAGTGGQRPVPRAELGDPGQRHAPVHLRGRRPDRPGQPAAVQGIGGVLYEHLARRSSRAVRASYPCSPCAWPSPNTWWTCATSGCAGRTTGATPSGSAPAPF